MSTDIEKMITDIAAQLDPAYVDLVAQLTPILRENVRLREERQAMRAVLADCEKHLSEWLQEFGGCDHAVNVCSCAEAVLLSKVRTVLRDGGAA